MNVLFFQLPPKIPAADYFYYFFRLQNDVTRNLVVTAYADQGQYASIVTASLQAHMRNDGILDRLIGLFNQLANMVTTSTNCRAEDSVGADDNSVMGFFLRRCWCDFTALSFEATCTLAQACEKYSDEFDCTKKEAVGAVSGTLRTRAVTDRFLAKQITDSLRGNITAGLAGYEEPVQDLLRYTQGDIPEALRGRLATAILRRDPLVTIDAVHQKFDAPTYPYLPSIGIVASGEAPPVPRDRIRLQTAALALASAHAKLGHVRLAMEAVNEALRTAQVARDDATLAHIFAVVCQTMETATPGTIELMVEPQAGVEKCEAHVDELKMMLEKLMARAEELGLPHLAGYAQLALARHLLIYPAKPLEDEALGKSQVEFRVHEDVPGMPGTCLPYFPRTCQASISTAAAGRYLGHLHLATTLCAALPQAPPSTSGLASLKTLQGVPDMFTSTPAAFGPSLMGAQAACATEVRRLAGGASLLRAAGLAMHGSTRLLQGHAIALLQSQGRRAPAEDKAVALAQLAVSLANTHGFEAAEKIFKLISQKFPETSNPVLYAARLSVAFRRACHRRDIRKALELSSLMISIGDPRDDGIDPTQIGYRMEGEEMAVEAYLVGGHLKKAEEAARTHVLPLARKHHQPLAYLRVLLLLARVFLKAEAWEVAMKYALSVYSQCREIHADLLQAEVVVLMCRIFRAQGELTRSLKEMDAAMPLIMAHGGLELKGRARMELAAIFMDQAKTKEELEGAAEQIFELLKEARHDFRQLEAFREMQHCFYLEALVHEGLGQVMEKLNAMRSMRALEMERADLLNSSDK